MPVIAIPVNELKKRLEINMKKNELLEILAQNGSDIEDVLFLQRYRCPSCNFIIEKLESEGRPQICDNCFTDFYDGSPEDLDPVEVIRMELLAVRPDLFEVAGLARSLRGYLDIETGLKEYGYENSDYLVEVDESLHNTNSFRPEIACAVIKNIRFDHFLIKSIMKLQENLHWAMGRNRKLASIGVYDLRYLTFPIKYTSTEKNKMAFNPLPYAEWDKKPMLPEDILKKHPKGKAFAHLLNNFSRYPMLIDNKDRVLSMPPVINSFETRITMDTSDILIDVTGPFRDKVLKTLNTFVYALLEMQKDIVLYNVNIRNREHFLTPSSKPEQMLVDLNDCNKLIGFCIDLKEMDRLLKKARYDTEIINEAKIMAYIPVYRSDIMHPHDIYEDIAIQYGYHNIVPDRISTLTEGSEHPAEVFSNTVREIFTGLSFIELNTLYLTNKITAFSNMLLTPDENTVIIENPASTEQEIVRPSIMPGLLASLSNNKHNPLPQKIYEIGDISLFNHKAETKSIDERKLSAIIIDSKTGFSDIRAVLQALFQALGKKFIIKPSKYPFYIEGRSGDIFYKNQGDHVNIGHIGEIHPEVISGFKLSNPVVGLEISLKYWIEEV